MNVTVKKIKRLLVVVVVLNLLAGAGYMFLFKNVKATNERISVLLNETETRSQHDAVLKSIKSVLAETEADRRKVTSYIVPKDGSVDFLVRIENLGKESGVNLKIKDLNVVNSSDTPESETLSLIVETRGSWRNVYHFFTLLELLPYKIVMNKIQLEKEKEGAGAVTANGLWRGEYQITVLKHI